MRSDRGLGTCSDNVSKELTYHGGKWASAHGSYFSDPAKAEPLVEAVRIATEQCSPEVIADIGGGTGFLLGQIRGRLVDARPRLVNVDMSRDQLDECGKEDMDVLCCSALELRREAVLRGEEKLMLVSRSVMHYFGRGGQDAFLAALRSVAKEGEVLVQQAACFASLEEKDCMNEIYPMMGVDKYYLTPDEMRDVHERNGWKVTSMLPAPALDLCSDDLAERYALKDKELESICESLRRHGLDERGIFSIDGLRFRGPFTYVIVTAQAV